VVGELGWCMKIIEDLSGRKPKYFRPPYGDIDNRVRALAQVRFDRETSHAEPSASTSSV
jgi:chitin deacetylase